MIVEKSNRKGKPFVIENCGGLSPNLIESRLFGHKKGGFTGAVSDRQGLFSVADGGTVFLDEIGDMPLDVQVKLLRVLESGEYYRVGDPNPSKTDVRVISATNKDVEKAISKGEFREDLYFRLNMAELYIPSLDEDKYKGQNRSADIPYLCYHYFKMYVEEQGPADWVYLKDKHDITPEYFSLFMLKEWPGNVRGIKRHMWRAFIEIKGMIRSVPKYILYKILENPDKDWELQTGIQDESKKSSIFRDDKFGEALRSFIFCNYNYSHVQKELNIGDWATVRNHINSAFLALGHHTVFNLDSFKDLLNEYGIKADQEELTKFITKSFKDIIECKLMDKKKLVYAKADEKEGYIDELFKAFPEMVKSVESQLQ
jgi:transcriptional regulator with PAS, ATPase and Fis domain